MVAGVAPVIPVLRGSMVKKGGDGKPQHASALRREWQTVAELRQSAQSLQDQAFALAQLADEVEEAGYKRVYVDGVRKFPNALKLLRVFVGNVQKAFIDEKNKN
jgi:hypothetical protein